MWQRDGFNQYLGLFEADDRPYDFGIVTTAVVGRQPNLVEGNLPTESRQPNLFQNSCVDL